MRVRDRVGVRVSVEYIRQFTEYMVSFTYTDLVGTRCIH